MLQSLTIAIIGSVLTASSAVADDQMIARAIRNAFSASSSSAAENKGSQTLNSERRHTPPPERPRPLPALYGGAVFLQSCDAYLTLVALKRGASEANPVLRPVSGEPIAFIAVKAGLTATSIVGVERLWKDNHRVSAVALMAASNALMIVINAHNVAVLRSLK